MNPVLQLSFAETLAVFVGGAVGGYVLARWGWTLASGYAGAMTAMIYGLWRHHRVPEASN